VTRPARDAAGATRLRELFPELLVEVEDLEGEQSLDAIRLGHVDVAIIDDLTWRAGRREGLRVTELFATPLVVMFAQGHRWAEANVVPWSELAEQPQATEQRTSAFGRSVEVECRRAGFEPHVHARVHDAGAMLALVEGGEMVTVLPELAVAGQPHAVGWRPLDPRVDRRLIAVTRTGQDELPAARELVEELARPGPAAPRPPDVRGARGERPRLG
jgi:DNA-binding transcriptional LysR family regulator